MPIGQSCCLLSSQSLPFPAVLGRPVRLPVKPAALWYARQSPNPQPDLDPDLPIEQLGNLHVGCLQPDGVCHLLK